MAIIPLTLAAAGAGLAWVTGDFIGLQFKPFEAAAIIGELTALFLISLFLERALEVFLASWRDHGRLDLEHALAQAKADAAVALDANKAAAQQAVLQAQAVLDKYRAVTANYTFACAVGAGIIVAIAGARTLGPLLADNPIPGPHQHSLMTVVDVLITGGLIGGGSAGVHKLVSVITDFLDSTRTKAAGS